jgi:hypothetical protein
MLPLFSQPSHQWSLLKLFDNIFSIKGIQVQEQRRLVMAIYLVCYTFNGEKGEIFY